MNNKKKELQENPNKDQSIIPEDLPIPLKEALNSIPEPERLSVIKSIRYYCSVYRGIIPSPDDLRKYNEIIPNGADRLTKMAEEQSAHRQRMEANVIKWQLFQSTSGQWMAFVIAIFALIITYLLAKNDHTVVATTLASTTIIGLVSTFIYGKIKQKKELEEKA